MGRLCIVRNCRGGKEKIHSNEPHITLFKVPKDPELFAAWKSNLPELRGPLNSSSYVCEKHFHSSDLISHYTHELPTETWKYSRGVKQLKPKAVPKLANTCVTPNNTILHDNNKTIENNINVMNTINPNNKFYGVKYSNSNREHRDVQMQSPLNMTYNSPKFSSDQLNCSNHQLSPHTLKDTSTLNHDTMDVQEIQIEKHNNYEVPFTFDTLLMNLDNLKYPAGCKWSYTITPDKKTIIFVSCPTDGILRRVDIYSDLSTKVLMDCICVHPKHLLNQLENMDKVAEFLTTVYNWNLCKTLKDSSRFIHDNVCEAIAPRNDNGAGRSRLRCISCVIKLESQQYRKLPPSIRVKKTLKRKALVQKVRRYKKKIKSLEEHVADLRVKFTNIEEQTLENAIINLKESQKILIRTCLEAAKKVGSGKKGMRYDIKWIYQCLLIRIKGPGLYDSLRENDTLPLPSRQTLRKYISSFDNSFGFKHNIFEALKQKNASKPRYERRGILLVDEIALSKMVTFDQKTLDILGFVGLGNHTPNHQEGQIGDHALVFMFQPFRGTWVQTLGCFLSKGATPSDTLRELTLECIIKLEDSGLLVDAVTTDGASWNRAMWTKFNVDENQVFCTHPCDEKRKLWFISDFPHLIKNMRNRIVEKKILKSPSGVIKLSHWEEVLKADNPDGFNLKVCPGLSYNVIHPKPFQKMNVRRAFRFFGIAAGMELYKENGITGLISADPTIEFLKIMNNLIRIMNSKTPGSSLKWDSNDRMDLKNFLKYLDDWEKIMEKEICDDRKKNIKTLKSITDSTLTGLRVTIKATLDLHEYLFEHEGDNLSYLMTCRLNQDALERFFSIIRTACGNNTHPSPVAFAQVFRLLSVYSLIKPPKGSNVDSTENFVTLLKPEDLKSKGESSGKDKLKSQIESILEKQPTDADNNDNENDAILNFIVEPFDHDYARQYTSDEVKSYVSGWIARRIKKFTKCENCIANLTTDESNNRDRLIELKTKGKLLIPSNNLYQTISIAENLILYTLFEEDLSNNLLSQIFSGMEDIKFPRNGCDDHDMRSQILSFFIIFRMHTLCNRYNDIYLSAKREDTQMHTKIAKL